MSEDRLITIEDFRKRGLCVFGMRTWFRACGLDFPDFIQNGALASKLLERADERGAEVIRQLLSEG